jgi:hypothetical protein
MSKNCYAIGTSAFAQLCLQIFGLVKKSAQTGWQCSAGLQLADLKHGFLLGWIQPTSALAPIGLA